MKGNQLKRDIKDPVMRKIIKKVMAQPPSVSEDKPEKSQLPTIETSSMAYERTERTPDGGTIRLVFASFIETGRPDNKIKGFVLGNNKIEISEMNIPDIEKGRILLKSLALLTGAGIFSLTINSPEQYDRYKGVLEVGFLTTGGDEDLVSPDNINPEDFPLRAHAYLDKICKDD